MPSSIWPTPRAIGGGRGRRRRGSWQLVLIRKCAQFVIVLYRIGTGDGGVAESVVMKYITIICRIRKYLKWNQRTAVDPRPWGYFSRQNKIPSQASDPVDQGAPFLWASSQLRPSGNVLPNHRSRVRCQAQWWGWHRQTPQRPQFTPVRQPPSPACLKLATITSFRRSCLFNSASREGCQFGLLIRATSSTYWIDTLCFGTG